tara:strand:+ start:613 stop:1512 length:900 start_codon:yes stop_codon:yes gene_type:complete
VKKKVLITGLNGNVAKTLAKRLDPSIYEITFLTSNKKHVSNNIFYWDSNKNYIDPEALKNTAHIIHLAGFNITNSWTSKNKQKMFNSRVETSNLLYKECKKNNIKPLSFISASAMGYYGFEAKGIQQEQDKAGNDWMARLCLEWEKAADNFQLIKTRVIKLRLSLIMDKHSGILQKTCLGFRFKTGLIFGDGSQSFPWIDIEDVAKFIEFTIQNKTVEGVFNLAAPEKISYNNFIKTVQQIKFKNSILFKIPKNVIEFFLPEKKSLLLNNTSLSTKKIESTGFKFIYRSLEECIKARLS